MHNDYYVVCKELKRVNNITLLILMHLLPSHNDKELD
jgi:hypothetical protein